MRYQLKITLLGIDPPIWRRVIMPGDFTLLHLHHVIQVAMGWEDCHLHDFTIKRTRYALPDAADFGNPVDESQSQLKDVVKPRTKFVYQYDFGDSWDLEILVEKAIDDSAAPEPVCVAGARACPPEDSGGPWGYAERLEALSDPDDEDGADFREWMGSDFDPELFDMGAVNEQLRKIFRPAPHKQKRVARRR